MTRRGIVFVHNIRAGWIEECADGAFLFQYEADYLHKHLPAVSLTMPLRELPYQSDILFPFFDGLIPEGWLLNLTTKNWKLGA